KYAGHIIIADEIKLDAAAAMLSLQKMGITTIMLSGDKQAVVDEVAKTLNIQKAFGDLLPEEKVKHFESLKRKGEFIVFAGDGVNDAPVVALADAGIAMGGLGSDATIETADIVIQNDEPSKIVSAIKIGKLTRNIVWQNISLAMGVKVLVLALGAGGIASLWEAVIADVGVALLAILNAVRIQNKKI
ncbi:MAG: HAD-IC family P-type ATPase, partial [Ferruginibacter sp.]